VQTRSGKVFMVVCGALVLMFSAGSLVPAEAGTYGVHGTRKVYKKKVPRYNSRSVQRALREAGYRIAVDGIIGPETRAALRQFQSDHGLTPSGEVNYQTLTKLGL
jgi:peptidoglycan hydrolase-like protein with peptidoglycan-binding domain